MNTQEQIKMTGRVKIAMNGEIVRDIKNLVVTAGKSWIADRMQQDSGTGKAVMGWMTIGTGTTAAAVGNTTLETQAFHQALTISGGAVTANVITFATTIGAGDGTAAITEAGIFNNATVDTGDMLARTVFAVINKGALDTMTITWDITIS